MARPAPEIAFIGDDFTGASDTLATLARTGRQARLFLDVPDPDAVGSDDAVGVATGLRAMPAAEISTQVAALAPRLARLGARFYHLKVCSTFDSSPDTGSIGAAVSALARTLDPALVVVIGGQPSLGRYCLFGTLFARAADGAVHRIDRHPVMAQHPVTPMGEADLRQHLAAQGLDGLQLIDRPTLRAGSVDDLARHLQGCLDGGMTRLLVDAVETGDLGMLGAALRRLETDRPVLMVGASSVAEALRDPASSVAHLGAFGVPPLDGATFVFAGSRSSVTEAQIAAAERFRKIPLPASVMSNAAARQRALETCVAALGEGDDVLAHLVASERYAESGAVLADLSADFVGAVVGSVALRRLGVAGGDTSSAVCRAVGLTSIEYLTDLDPGVALCAGRADSPRLDGIRLMLKGGQMGGPSLYDRFATSVL
ncbi:four-carbon acid sugar kinase family protein [Amorphus coralli]|uniref:four-carbon acid sugar kinase family protein n=1 Tax=Amorphus coralli TaxID=340680 RepID=UPI0003690A6C|nr:four-carbon acid sugar kinase family protein [Amorphus coralli]